MRLLVHFLLTSFTYLVLAFAITPAELPVTRFHPTVSWRFARVELTR